MKFSTYRQGEVQKPYEPVRVQPNIGAIAAANSAGGLGAVKEGLDKVNQEYIRQIENKMSINVLEATNYYNSAIDELINDPKQGLLNTQDVNALDITDKFRAAEKKIRRETMQMLPRYEKAHIAFSNLADRSALETYGKVTKHQTDWTNKHRDLVVNQSLSNSIDRAIESGDPNRLFSLVSEGQQIITAAYGSIYGSDVLQKMQKDFNTIAAENVLKNIITSGNDGDMKIAANLLQKMSPFIEDAKLTDLKSMLTLKQRSNDKYSLAREAYKMYPNDPQARRNYIRTHRANSAIVSSNKNGVISVEETIRRIIVGESNGDESAVSTEGAVGKYQILKSSYEEWAPEVGLSPDSPMTAENLKTVCEHKLRQYYAKYGPQGAAVAWYSGEQNAVRWVNGEPDAIDGEGNHYAWDASLSNGPSIKEYVEVRTVGKGVDGNQSYDLALSAADDPDIENLQPALKTALPSIGGILQSMGLAQGAEITSGYRDAARNAAASGVPGSAHMEGNTLDIVIPGITPDEKESVASEFKQYFQDAFFHDAGSGDHLHLQRYQGGLEQSGGNPVSMYSEAEIEEMANISDVYQGQAERQAKAQTKALVDSGFSEMQQLHDSGVTDIESYQKIVDKYGFGNSDAYTTLHSRISTYAKIRSGNGILTGKGVNGVFRMQIKNQLLNGKINDTVSLDNSIKTLIGDGMEVSESDYNYVLEEFQKKDQREGAYSLNMDRMKDSVAAYYGFDDKDPTFKYLWQSAKQVADDKITAYATKRGHNPSDQEVLQYLVDSFESNQYGALSISNAELRARGIRSVDEKGGTVNIEFIDDRKESFSDPYSFEAFIKEQEKGDEEND